MRSILASLLILSLLAGCFPQPSPQAMEDTLADLITLSNTDVAKLAQSVEQPVIVEFSVLHGCVRCAEMRPQVERLASEQAASIPIKRADFVSNQPLLQSLGATVCPTYVLFAPGSPPHIHNSPQMLISLADPAPRPLTP